jgi:hypothetical protein
VHSAQSANVKRSHVTLFRSQQNTTSAHCLPRGAANAAEYVVRFVGPWTRMDVALKKNAYNVRRATISQLLTFFTAHNSLAVYRQPIDDDALAALPEHGLAPGVRIDIVDAELRDTEQELAAHDPLGLDEADVDVDRGPERTILINTRQDAPAADAELQRARASLLVRRGNELVMPAIDLKVLESTFPLLFPFGRGSDEQRAVDVGLERRVRHYLRLSSRAFAQHATFVLIVADIVARQAVMTSVSLRMHHNARLANEIAQLTREDTVRALDRERTRRSAVDRGEHDVAAAAAADNNNNNNELHAGADVSAGTRATFGQLMQSARASSTKHRGS